MILSEKEAAWSKFSEQVNVGDIFEARVGSVEDYGAFIHLRFPDGMFYFDSCDCSFPLYLFWERVLSGILELSCRFLSSHWTGACLRGFMGFSSGCKRYPN